MLSLALLARGSAWSAAGSNHMTLNYCQADARFPHRFKVAVNVEDQGSRDGVIDDRLRVMTPSFLLAAVLTEFMP